jgi:hypothetical protein
LTERWLITALAVLGLVVLGELASTRARRRLDHVPAMLLRFAVGRLPVEIRVDVGDEWHAELFHILRARRPLPVIRLGRGIAFAVGLIFTAPQIGRDLAAVRDGPYGAVLRAAASDSRDATAGIWRLARDVNGHTPLAEFVVAVGMGGFVALWDGWRWALASVLLLVCASACYRRCRSLMRSVTPPELRARAARRRTRRRLLRLTWVGYVCLHGCPTPDGKIIDHVVIGPTGIHVLSSQWLDRRLPVRMSAGAPLYHGPYACTELLQQVRQQAAQLAALLGTAPGAPGPIRPCLVIYGASVWTDVPRGDVDVLPPRRLRKWLRHGKRKAPAAEVEQMTAAVAQALSLVLMTPAEESLLAE